jgi:predicted nuclease with TOPRIM domain
MNNRTEQLVKETAAALGTEPEQLTAVITKFKKELQELESETSVLEKQLKKIK